jgi:hypothetical protein
VGEVGMGEVRMGEVEIGVWFFSNGVYGKNGFLTDTNICNGKRVVKV